MKKQKIRDMLFENRIDSCGEEVKVLKSLREIQEAINLGEIHRLIDERDVSIKMIDNRNIDILNKMIADKLIPRIISKTLPRFIYDERRKVLNIDIASMLDNFAVCMRMADFWRKMGQGEVINGIDFICFKAPASFKVEVKKQQIEDLKIITAKKLSEMYENLADENLLSYLNGLRVELSGDGLLVRLFGQTMAKEIYGVVSAILQKEMLGWAESIDFFCAMREAKNAEKIKTDTQSPRTHSSTEQIPRPPKEILSAELLKFEILQRKILILAQSSIDGARFTATIGQVEKICADSDIMIPLRFVYKNYASPSAIRIVVTGNYDGWILKKVEDKKHLRRLTYTFL